jgi:hypothetical protein
MKRRPRTWNLFAAALIGLLITGAVPALAAPTLPGALDLLRQDDGAWRCVEVNGQFGLNVRSGPGEQYPVVWERAPGEQFAADYTRLQREGNYNWVPVRFVDGEGWSITARLSPCAVDAGGDVDVDHDLVLEAVDQDGALDRFEIEAIARSVVLVGSVRGTRIFSTGTGTIITPDGLIVTNAHVVDTAERVAVALLEDINDPPEIRYFGEVVGLNREIDVALVAIREDAAGRPVTSDVSLPYIPASLGADDVFRGDTVYIFGYPGIGDDYLVVTSGAIVSVENGDINGQRMPVWYRTDAEIAPGSSGGLVVNGDGQFVGIPTFVRSESQTGGRLGGIRPAEVALMAVLGEASTGPASNAEAPLPVDVVFYSLALDHGAIIDGLPGIALRVSFGLDGWQDRDATVFARFFHDDVQNEPLINLAAPSFYRDDAGAVLTAMPITPCCEKTDFEDLTLFVPYIALGLEQAGTYPLKIKVEVAADDASWRQTLSWEYITYTLR